MSQRRIRVLIYIKNLNGGGAERVVVHLLNELDRSRFEPKLLLGTHTGPYVAHVSPQDVIPLLPTPASDPARTGPRSLVARLRRGLEKRVRRSLAERSSRHVHLRGDDPHTLRDARELLAAAWQSEQVRSLGRVVREWRPDVVVSHLIESASVHVFVDQLRWRSDRVPYRWIAVEQNNTKVRFNAWYDEREAAAWCTLTRSVYDGADAVVAVGQGVKSGLVEHFGIESGKIALIHNGIDVEAVANAVPIETDRPFVLAVGRLGFQKNFSEAIHAFASIADQVEEDLVILGEGEERPQLEELIRRNGLEGRVRLPGFTSNVWGYMKAASCFVMTSRFEGFSMALLEAMAAGCPPVTFDFDYGAREVIAHRQTGMLVPAGDTEALSRAMLEVLRDDAFRRGLAERGREAVAAYDSHAMTRGYEDLIETVLTGRA